MNIAQDFIDSRNPTANVTFSDYVNLDIKNVTNFMHQSDSNCITRCPSLPGILFVNFFFFAFFYILIVPRFEKYYLVKKIKEWISPDILAVLMAGLNLILWVLNGFI